MSQNLIELSLTAEASHYQPRLRRGAPAKRKPRQPTLHPSICPLRTRSIGMCRIGAFDGLIDLAGKDVTSGHLFVRSASIQGIHMRNHFVVAMLAMTCLMACQQRESLAAETPAVSMDSLALPPIESAEQKESSSLLEFLQIYASDKGKEWETYRIARQVTWLEAGPAEYAEGRYSWKGKLLLTGLGETQVPNGKEGSEYETVNGSEGEAGITLTGKKDHVDLVSVKKFHFTEDFTKLLRNQLAPSITVKPIAGNCVGENADSSAKNTFFEVLLARDSIVYAEAFLDEGGKYSPGYTVFDFARTRPDARIKRIGCQTF